MAGKEKLADQIRANVERAVTEKKTRKGTGLPKSPASNAYVAAHRHCQVCQTPISIKNDPPICGSSECDKEHEARERARKRWTILMYAAPGIMILTLLIGLI